MTTVGAPVRLRPVRWDDPAERDFLRAVYASSRADELAILPWTEVQKEAFLRMQFDAQDTYYRQNYPDAAFDIIECGDQAAGRLYVDRRPDDIRIIDIALLPEERGKGVGSGLLHEILAEADTSGRIVSLHVETFNPAFRLYQRLGFVPVGENGPYFLMERRPG